METKITDSAGGVIINNSGEIVIVEQDNNTWSFPKGHVDPGEDFLTTAKREIHEETGITELEYIKAFEPYERFKMKDAHTEDQSEKKHMHLFLFKSNQKELQPIDPGNPQALWIPKNQAAAKLSHPKDKEFMEKILPELP